MLEPALVLESDLSVESALAELERYANFAHVVVRFARPEREPDWYAMPAHRLRWLLEGVDGNETLDAALDLDETRPSRARRHPPRRTCRFRQARRAMRVL
jgi:hypothetical protein